MATAAVPQVTDIPPFPALSDRTEGNYNAMAYAFGSHMSTKFKPELIAVAANVLQNANEAVAKAAAASEAAAVATAAVSATRDAAADAASAQASRQAAAESALAASQSATSAQQAKQSVDQSLAAVAGGPVISINGRTGVITMKEFYTGDVIVSARGDYSAPEYLPMDGGTYLRSSYPNLAAVIPIAHPAIIGTTPSTLPPDAVRSIAAEPNGYVAIGSTTSPFLMIYERSGNNLIRRADPQTNVTDSVLGAAFDASGTYLAVSNYNTVPGVYFYKRTNNLFARISPNNGAVAGYMIGVAWGVAMSPDGIYTAVAGTNVNLYKRTGDAFNKISSPAVSSGSTTSVAFGGGSIYLAAGGYTSPWLYIYKRNGDVFDKMADPATMPTGSVSAVEFSVDGLYLAVASGSTIYVYKRVNDSFQLLYNLNPAIGTINNLSFSPNMQFLAVAGSTGQYIANYRRTGDLFSRMTRPEPGPTSSVYSVSYTPDSTMQIAGTILTPYIYSWAVGFNTNTLFKLPIQQTADGSGLVGYMKT